MDLAIPTVELPPSFDIESQLSVWRTILLSYLSDDNIIRKLWCLSPLMQHLLTQHLTNLTCHLLSAVEPDKRYAYPNFLSQLTALKKIRIVRSRVDQLDNALLLPKISWDIIPDSVNTISIGSHKLLGHNEGSTLTLLTLTCQRHHLVVKFENDLIPWEFREYAFNQLISDPHTSDSHTLPYSHISYLTSLEREECERVRSIWSKLPAPVVDWLMIYWVPLVVTLFLDEPSDPELEQWCYDLFPNIHRIDGMATTLPVSIRLHSQNNTCNVHGSPKVGSHTHPHLNSMDISVKSSPSVFPSSLHTLYLLLLDDKMAYKSIAAQVVKLLSMSLTDLTIVVGSGNASDMMTIWELDLVAALPRGLKGLHTISFPADIQHWKALPPDLTDLDVNLHFAIDQGYRKGLDTYTNLNYQVISPHLKSLNTCLSNTDYSLDIARSMPDLSTQISAATLSRFQSLVHLVLHLNHPDVVKGGIPGLPLTIESLKLIINFASPTNSPDPMSNVRLPERLQRLIVTSDTPYHSDFQQWQVFPNTLHVIEFYGMSIKRLPLIWPKQLRSLVLGNCTGPLDPLMPFFMQTSQAPSDKVLRISNIAASLSTSPHYCIISITKGRLRFQEEYLLVDRATQTITVHNPVAT